ncbi:TAP-like protein-domain-containing protein [Elsinoe ampelina]|uniref:TAP-like protein-domain-containing protein n=1 Tax=Elsinoe ampelina TaxID=302913 RepID=A0A6A6G3P6_9PEZI|nr:TAP-like protein-domain-containing protein [Elsinoe ampelina]
MYAIQLNLMKIPATRQPVLGNVFVNYGGPGDDPLVSFASPVDLQQTVGEQYNLIAIEPRGVGDTIAFDCADTPVRLPTADPSIQGRNQSDLNDIDWHVATTFADQCHHHEKDTGDFVGTMFVARDMLRVLDASGGDGFLRYVGYSYGTVIGATFAAMFPERVERMMLDGVDNVHQYYRSTTVEQYIDTDKALGDFCHHCAAHPSKCDFAGGRSATKLMKAIRDMVGYIQLSPVQIQHEDGTEDWLNDEMFRTSIFHALYNPMSSWWDLGRFLYQIENFNKVPADLSDFIVSPFLGPFDQHLVGIACGDDALRSDDLAYMQKRLKQDNGLSILTAGLPDKKFLCAQWLFQARERPALDFFDDVETANPILFVSSKHDPITPLVSARNVTKAFPGSRLLVQNSVGHTASSIPSNCTTSHLQQYFANGTLPKKHTICQPNDPAFKAVWHPRRKIWRYILTAAGVGLLVSGAVWAINRLWRGRTKSIEAQ